MRYEQVSEMSQSQSVRTRRPKSATRSIILQHAHQMYLEGKLIPGDERLALVLEELGYTTGAGYQIWPNQAAFREDLIGFIAENIDYVSLRAAAGPILEIVAQNLPFEEHVLAAGDRFITGFLGREEFYLKLRFVALSDDQRPDDVTLALRAAYEKASWEACELFESVLEYFGRQLREPLVMHDLTGAVTAALEGYALRSRVQPERVSTDVASHGGNHHMFSLVFLAILKDFTEPIAD